MIFGQVVIPIIARFHLDRWDHVAHLQNLHIDVAFLRVCSMQWRMNACVSVKDFPQMVTFVAYGRQLQGSCMAASTCP
jgi:hypothetical protein